MQTGFPFTTTIYSSSSLDFSYSCDWIIILHSFTNPWEVWKKCIFKNEPKQNEIIYMYVNPNDIYAKYFENSHGLDPCLSSHNRDENCSDLH